MRLLKADKSKRFEADDYLSKFLRLDPAAGSEYQYFADYLDWLMGIERGDSGGGGIELMLYDDRDDACVFHEFKSVHMLKSWFDSHSPRPRPTKTFSPSP